MTVGKRGELPNWGSPEMLLCRMTLWMLIIIIKLIHKYRKTKKTYNYENTKMNRSKVNGASRQNSAVRQTTRGQSNLTKSASRGVHSPVRGHPSGSKVVPLNSWGRVSY